MTNIIVNSTVEVIKENSYHKGERGIVDLVGNKTVVVKFEGDFFHTFKLYEVVIVNPIKPDFEKQVLDIC